MKKYLKNQGKIVRKINVGVQSPISRDIPEMHFWAMHHHSIECKSLPPLQIENTYQTRIIQGNITFLQVQIYRLVKSIIYLKELLFCGFSLI